MVREWRGSKAPAMNTFVETTSVGETHELGRRLAQVLEPGDVIALEGELGTGKTELVKGIAEALGVTSGVHSPTFVLHHHYQGRVPIEHYDLYRLDGMAWVDTLLDDPSPDAVTVIEWPDRPRPCHPDDRGRSARSGHGPGSGGAKQRSGYV